MRRLCTGYARRYRAVLYPCPETPAERREMAIGVMSRIEDLKTVLGQTQDHRHRVLVAAAKNVRMWFTKARKIKAIYHTLNLFNLDVTQKCLIAECWCPTGDLDKIQMALKRATVSVVRYNWRACQWCAGGERLVGAEHSESHGRQAGAADLSSYEQGDAWLSDDCRLVRCGNVS